MPSRRPARATLRAAAGAGVFVLLAGLCLPLAGLFFVGLDHDRTDVGMLCALRHALDEGSLLVSPLLGNGGLLWARPDSQVLYPLRWLVLPLPVDWAVAVEGIAHLALGAAGAAFLARTFRVRPLAAACAGVAFALSGTAVDLIRHTQYIVGIAWLPWGWAAARRAVGPRGRPWHLAVAAASLTASLLGGEPQAFVIGCALVVLEVGFSRPWRAGRRARLAALGVVPASAALGMVAWIPTLLEARVTHRVRPMDLTEALGWALRPADALGLVLPGVLEHPLRPGTNLLEVLHGVESAAAWNALLYVGALLLAAALLSGLVGRVRSAFVVLVLGALVSLGEATPVLPALMRLLPPLALFRYPAKYLLVTTLAAAVCGVAVLDAASRNRRLRRALLAALGVSGAALVLALGAVLLRAEALQAVAEGVARRAAGESWPTLPEALASALGRALIPVVGAGVLLASRRLGRFVPLLVAADVTLFAAAAVEVGPPLAGFRSPLADLAGTPVLCVDERLEGEYPVRGSPGAGRSVHHRLWGAPDLQACDGLVGAVPYSPLVASSVFQLHLTLPRAPVAAARALGCTHLVTWKSALPEAPELPVRGAAAAAIAVVEVPGALAPAFVVREPVAVPTQAAAVASVLSAQTAQDAARVVDLPGGAAPQELPAGIGVQVAGVEWLGPAQARLSLTGSGGAVVGLRRSWLVGWGASQAGRPLPVLRSAGAHVAVLVPDAAAGPVELRYRLPGAGWGLAVGLAGALGLAALLGFASRRTRNRNGPRALSMP